MFNLYSNLSPNGESVDEEDSSNQFHVGFNDRSEYQSRSKIGYFAGVVVCLILTLVGTVVAVVIIHR